MSTDLTNSVFPAQAAALVPPLHSGDRLTRDEFERRYAASPEDFKAELIEGVVYVAAAVSLNHGFASADLGTWLGVYAAQSPGVRHWQNSTVRLDLRNIPQPDVGMYIEASRGGQSQVSVDGYLEGPPELVGEVAVSTASYDLHDKLRAYQRNGVKEYLVWRVLDEEIDWFALRGAVYEKQLPVNAIHKSEVFPGLWLDPTAMIAGKMARVLDVLREGLASPEHQQFVDRLKSTSPPAAS